MTPSSWWHRHDPVPTPAPDRPPGTTDVVVVGAGIAGLLTATELRGLGIEVVVVEARTAGSGTTGSSTAKVTALHGASYGRLRREHGRDAARHYARANLAGLAHVVSTIGRLGIECDLWTTFASTYATEADTVTTVEEEADAATAAGLDVHLVDHLDLPVDVVRAVVAPGQAMVDPVALSRGLADHLRSAGAAVVEGCRVLDVDLGDPCVVHTDRGDIRAGTIVMTTLLPTVDPGLLFARAEPSMSHALAARLTGPVPDGLHLSVDAASRSIRPAGPGSPVGLFGGPSHRVGEGDPEASADGLRRWVEDSFAVEEVLAEWSAHDVLLSDGLPAIGAVDDDGRMFVATGFRKWGFTHAGATALLVADELAGRRPGWAALFDPRRMPVHGVGEIARTVADNATVARHLVGDRVAVLTAPRLTDLQPGEAAVVLHDGRPTAARREANGSYLLLSARCPHLGCQVTWNGADRTWDCPCHGSRFDEAGTVVAGPANRDLGPA